MSNLLGLEDYEMNVGDKVILITSIYDNGEDHHLPRWITKVGEIVEVKNVCEKSIAVAHSDITDETSFVIYEGEYEAV